MRRINSLNREINTIKEIEILFPNIDFNAIEKFVDSFVLVAIDPHAENIESLKINTKVLDERDILQSLWSTLKEI